MLLIASKAHSHIDLHRQPFIPFQVQSALLFHSQNRLDCFSHTSHVNLSYKASTRLLQKTSSYIYAANFHFSSAKRFEIHHFARTCALCKSAARTNTNASPLRGRERRTKGRETLSCVEFLSSKHHPSKADQKMDEASRSKRRTTDTSTKRTQSEDV